MGGHRLAGPDRTDFRGRPVADREYKIESWSAGGGELIPTLAAEPFRRQMIPLEHGERQRMHLPFRMTSSAVRLESTCAAEIEQRFRHDAPG